LRVLIHDYSGHPFQAQLSRSLARRGHHVVHAYYPMPGARTGAVEALPADPATLSFQPVTIRSATKGQGLFNRPRHDLTYGGAVGRVVRRVRPDVVVSANTPLLAERLLVRATRRSGAAFVYWFQDAWAIWLSGTARRRFGVLGVPLAHALNRLQRSLLTGSDAVVPISPAFRDLVQGYGVPASKVTLIPNWAPIDEIVPVDRHNGWSREHGLDDGLVFLYAGALGVRHAPRLLFELANELADTTLVVVSSSAEADDLAAEAERQAIRNVRVLPIQPYAVLPEVLGTADVVVALLDRNGARISVPSKVLSYMAAGRPVLAAMPVESYAAQVLTQSGAGHVVEPDDRDAWISAARELAADPDRRARMATSARTYAESAFDIERITTEFEKVLEAAVRRRRGN
jgi:glycosyltransferase involved in cell wall biosynthesis